MSGLSIALIAAYWVSALLSWLLIVAAVWVVSRSILVTGFVSMGWCWVSVWLFGIYRVMVSIEAMT